MKRMCLFLLTAIILLSACSFKQKADNRIEAYVKSVIPDPNFSIENKDVKWENDSLCIIDFRVRAKNNFGGYEFTEYEYILVKDNGMTYECLINSGVRRPVFAIAAKSYWDLYTSDNKWEFGRALHMMAFAEAMKNGRKVE